MRYVLATVLGLLLVSVPGYAAASPQAQGTSTINGTVKDQSGAVLPGVEITVTQTDTGIARTAVSDETGAYILPNLAVGPYRLEAALPVKEMAPLAAVRPALAVTNELNCLVPRKV